jgi:enoyl-CoA hydratase/carnithine racemase
MSKAAEMSFTGDRIDAEEALNIGLISYLTAQETLMTEANLLATRIAANPGLVLRMTKKLLREGQRQDLASLLELSANLQSIAHKTKDHQEAVNAFLEKRKPNFQ